MKAIFSKDNARLLEAIRKLSENEKKKFIKYLKNNENELHQIKNFIRFFRKIAKLKEPGLGLLMTGRQESKAEKEEKEFCLVLERLIVSFLKIDACEHFINKIKFRKVKKEYYLRLIPKALIVVDNPFNYNSLNF